MAEGSQDICAPEDLFFSASFCVGNSEDIRPGCGRRRTKDMAVHHAYVVTQQDLL